MAATYVCLTCRSVAVDVAAVAQELHDPEPVEPLVLECPGCGLEMLPPDDDAGAVMLQCPACETRFAIEEGMRHLT
ncbi:MAG: hypothetical protein JOY68_02045 [Candidatus Dormibacteraeota bacterium]|nr:hypothetical protein [Candidatus Dormibacteraeota bacterium]